jgi:NADPH:quinone reductase-like Zn-dependent oxidoreductase
MTMKAILWTKYGPPDVLQLAEVAKPVPKANEVLVKIHATTVSAGDCELRRLKFNRFLALPLRLYVGLSRPTRIKILGQELAGEIESIGDQVTRFKPGDAVFGSSGFSLGTYAEYKCLPQVPNGIAGTLALKPINLSYEQAAAVPLGGLEALHALRKGKLRSGQNLLIIGAGGSIGTYAVQLARHFGAEVTGVDRTDKLDMLRSIGAQRVLDYTREDYTKSGETYDVILDVVGKSSFSGCIRSLKENGRYLISNPDLWQMMRGRLTSLTGSKKVLFETASPRVEDLDFLKDLLEAGSIRPIIDRSYPLDQAAEAHRYVEGGHKKGNVVISLELLSES